MDRNQFAAWAVLPLLVSTACAVGEPLEEDVLVAAAERLDSDPISANGDDDGPEPSSPNFQPSPGNGPDGDDTDGDDDPASTPNVNGVPVSPSNGTPSPTVGDTPVSNPNDPSPTSTRLVPMIPTVGTTPTATPNTPVDEPSNEGGAGGEMVVAGGAGGMGGVGGTGGTDPGNGAGATDEEIAASDVVIRYGAMQSMPSGQISARLLIENRNQTEPLPLEQLTIRYWYTSDGQSFNFHSYYSGAAVMGTTGAHGMSGTEEYIELSFSGGMVSYTANMDFSRYETQLTMDGTFDQTNDWSFDASLNNEANSHITAYRSGVLIWGDEPAGAEPAE